MLALGVTLSSDAPAVSLRRLWEAAAQAFSSKRYYVPVTDGEQLEWALKRGFLGGVLAEIWDNAYDTCEAFATQNAQQLYKRFPVLVRNEGKTENAARFAAQWHAMAVENIPGALAGWRIALRRLTYPKELTVGGFAPMRFWWNNRGPSYCHGDMEVRLRLEKDGQYTPIRCMTVSIRSIWQTGRIMKSCGCPRQRPACIIWNTAFSRRTVKP